MKLFNHKTGRFTSPKAPMTAGGIMSMEEQRKYCQSTLCKRLSSFKPEKNSKCAPIIGNHKSGLSWTNNISGNPNELVKAVIAKALVVHVKK